MVMGQAIDQDGGLWYVLDAAGEADHDAFSVTPGKANGNPGG